MIHEVDESLRLLMRQDALHGSDVEILFEAPTKEWASRRNTPTIDVYLYDIREDLSRAHEGIANIRDENGRVVARKPAPRYFRLSYLITAWTQRPEDEHRLLSACLNTFLRHRMLPQAVLVGTLLELGLTVPLSIALPPPQDRSISDIWTALGGELKPSLDLVVSAPMESGAEAFVGPALTEAPLIGLRKVDPDTAIPGLSSAPDADADAGAADGDGDGDAETAAGAGAAGAGGGTAGRRRRGKAAATTSGEAGTEAGDEAGDEGEAEVFTAGRRGGRAERALAAGRGAAAGAGPAGAPGAPGGPDAPGGAAEAGETAARAEEVLQAGATPAGRVFRIKDVPRRPR